MLGTLRSDLRRLRRGRPGQRFQDVHEARRGSSRPRWPRYLWLALGCVLVALGPLAGLVPGPGGIVVFLLGALLLARELRGAAQALDWAELRLRRGWRWTRARWSRAPTTARLALGLLGLALLGGCGYLGYALLA